MVIDVIDVAITKLSSKGQIVIPLKMRDNFSVGEKFVIIKSGERLILKKASDLDKNVEEDITVAKRTEEAIKRYEKGIYKEMDSEDFAEELEKW